MYHSIQFIKDSEASLYNSQNKLNGRNTWTNWGLIPTSRPVMNPPSFKSNYIDVPGADGSIDASTLLTSYPTYQNRTGSTEFIVTNGDIVVPVSRPQVQKRWEVAYSDIMDYCHGRKMKIIFEDDPAFYYRGRVTVNSWKSDKDWAKITLDYTVDPYKYDLFKSTDQWRWDPFSFVDGIIRNPDDYKDVTFEGKVNGNGSNLSPLNDKSYELSIPCRTMPSVLEFTAKADTANKWLVVGKLVTSSGTTRIQVSKKVVLTEANTVYTFRVYGIKLYNNETVRLAFYGEDDINYTVSIIYQGGRL